VTDGRASKRALPLHPFLAAAFPVLFLYAKNVRYAVTFRNVLGPLVVTLLGTGVVFAVTWLLLGQNALAGAIVTTVAVILFFSIGPIHEEAGEWAIGGVRVVRFSTLYALSAVILAASVFVATKPKGNLPSVTTALNVVAGGLVLLNVATIAYNEVNLRSTRSPAPVTSQALHRPPSGITPDIYYIVVEDYGGERTLRDGFGYDNAPFLNALEQRGFVVAHDSTANYPRTSLSLASSLNMQYLDAIARETNGAGPERRLVPLISSPLVVDLLKSAGYSYVHLGSWYTPTATTPRADVDVRFGAFSEFSSALLQTTAIWPLGAHIGPFVDYFDVRRREYDRVRFQFRELEKLPSLKGPKFVFAHIISPHDPYVFDRQGRYVPESEQVGKKDKRQYVDQLSYLNTLMLRMVDGLLQGPPDRRPVIILQSDEGPFAGSPTRWKRYSARLLQQKFEILNAYFLPGQGGPSPYPSITPVNTFRLVLNRYFDAGLPLLPDRNYVFSSLKLLYTFQDVTASVPK
jgi:hypothetical protein